MKKIIAASVVSLCLLGFSYSGHAQSTADKVEATTKKDAKKVGHKTAELASKGKSRVTDKVYKDKVGPAGQTIYIDGHSRYYWVDKRGHRRFVEEADLKDKAPM